MSVKNIAECLLSGEESLEDRSVWLYRGSGKLLCSLAFTQQVRPVPVRMELWLLPWDTAPEGTGRKGSPGKGWGEAQGQSSTIILL